MAVDTHARSRNGPGVSHAREVTMFDLFHVTHLETKAYCAEPSMLPLVDAAFDNPTGPEAHDLRQYLCPRCPSAATCLQLGMEANNPGIWGGTTQNQRTRAGAPGNYTTERERRGHTAA